MKLSKFRLSSHFDPFLLTSSLLELNHVNILAWLIITVLTRDHMMCAHVFWRLIKWEISASFLWCCFSIRKYLEQLFILIFSSLPKLHRPFCQCFSKEISPFWGAPRIWAGATTGEIWVFKSVNTVPNLVPNQRGGGLFFPLRRDINGNRFGVSPLTCRQKNKTKKPLQGMVVHEIFTRQVLPTLGLNLGHPTVLNCSLFSKNRIQTISKAKGASKIGFFFILLYAPAQVL